MVAFDPDLAARAFAETWQHLFAAIAGGWTVDEPGVTTGVSGVALPTVNGVWVHGTDVDAGVVGALLDRVAATGLPFCLQARPQVAQSMADVAADRAMTPDEVVPLMVLAEVGDLQINEAPPDLTVRELVPEEAVIHARVAAPAFEAPVEAFVQLMSPSALSAPGVRCYVGEVEGQPVTTGFGVTRAAYVAIFNIATLPTYRRRGYGAAITTRAVADGVADGAKWAWLQSSSAGYKVYQGLGFRTAEDWHCWVSSAGQHP
jgi:GNAT superfamily N-acetyltransferase